MRVLGVGLGEEWHAHGLVRLLCPLGERGPARLGLLLDNRRRVRLRGRCSVDARTMTGASVPTMASWPAGLRSRRWTEALEAERRWWRAFRVAFTRGTGMNWGRQRSCNTTRPETPSVFGSWHARPPAHKRSRARPSSCSRSPSSRFARLQPRHVATAAAPSRCDRLRSRAFACRPSVPHGRWPLMKQALIDLCSNTANAGVTLPRSAVRRSNRLSAARDGLHAQTRANARWHL